MSRCVRHVLATGLGLAVLLAPLVAHAAPAVHHELTATLDPQAHGLQVTDRITLPEGDPAGATVRFRLHPDLAITVADTLTLVAEDPAEGLYRARLLPGRNAFTLTYGGPLYDPPSGPGGDTTGLIDAEGALLSGASRWYPQVLDDQGNDALLTFALTVDLPAAWDAISQGGREAKHAEGDRLRTTWAEAQPQDEIYLVAGPYTESVVVGGPAAALVFLRAPDPGLADRYLTATVRYLVLYSRLIGPYPYRKFALVENRWETGFGMPSFTLMGPTVIRLPFIVDTSYPHEILHNWWGNGVFVDPAGGNWAEGLTAYLADHLLRERTGEGAAYRREALQRYADFAQAGRDFPLEGFTARHGRVTQAVGYDKALMLIHMVRRRMGDTAFLTALRHFYSERRFTRAGWDDLEAAFSHAAGRDLHPLFDALLTRTGAPALAVSDARAEAGPDGYRLTATLRQTGDGPPYPLVVPVAVSLKDNPEAVWRDVPLTGTEAAVDLTFPTRPLWLDVDPRFDLFRRLAPGETPPALSGLFGAEKTLFVLPADAPETVREAYGTLARAWGEGARIVPDAALADLPEDGTAVWLLGRENRFLRAAAVALGEAGNVVMTDAGVILPDGPVAFAGHTLVFAARTPGGAPLGWVATDDPAALPGLARKVPHYTKYGYLAFEGDAPDNVLKGQWPPGRSALSVPVVQPDGGVPTQGRMPPMPRPPLVAP
jgi:aminopeptidase N